MTLAQSEPRVDTFEGSITLRDVTMEFTTRDRASIRAVDTTSLTIPSGQFVSVLGPSGCGKSTLLRMIAGLMPPTSGSVSIGGEPVSGPSRKVGIAFQTPSLLEWYTVAENIALPARMGRRPADKRSVERRVEPTRLPLWM